MTQIQFDEYNISGSFKYNEYTIPVFSKFPEVFGDCWIQITKLNHEYLKYVICFYFNDEYPTGTVIVSDYIRNDYGDIFITFFHNNESDRIYINPKFRKRRFIVPACCVIRSIFFKAFGVIIQGTRDAHETTWRAYTAFKDMLGEECPSWTPTSQSAIQTIDPPRNPVLPYIWYNHRIGGKNE